MELEVREHRIAVPGGEIFAREWIPARRADGEPFVLLHDSLGCVQVWRDFPALLSAGTARRVIAYDRLGFGRSSGRHDRLSLDFVTEEAQVYLPCLLDELRIDRFIPFGHSVGGGMALHAGVVLRGSCRAIISESAQAFAEDRTLNGIAAGRIEYSTRERFERLEKYHGDKAQWVLHAWTDTWLAPEFAAWSLRADLPLMDCPILAIHGDQDEFGSTKHPELIRALSGGPVQVSILRDCGHVPHKEQPDTIIDLVTRFLA